MHESKKIGENRTLLNDHQLKLIRDKLSKTNPEFRFLNLKINAKILYDIIINSKEDINNSKLIINNFYEKTKNNKNLMFIIKTTKNNIFGGYTQAGFNLENNIKSLNIYDSNAFVFSIDNMKVKIFNLSDSNNACIFCNHDKFPEFREQIMFDKNYIKYGYTGEKNKGFLVDDDYILNNGEKIFQIKQIQVISIYSF